MPETLRFCADVHLGKLAHLLKMLAYDTVYKNDFTKEDLHQIARNENLAFGFRSPVRYQRFQVLQGKNLQSNGSM